MKDKPDSPFHVTDRRFWVQDESVLENASPPARKYPGFVEELKARTEAAEQRLKERLEQLDQENEAFRVRLNKEMERRLEQEKLELYRNFLEIIDNLERALQAADDSSSFEALREGVKLNLELFLGKLKSLGIEPLAVLHRPFDPREAQAVGVVTVNDPALDNQVMEVVRQGFQWGDKVLRPAHVRVAQYKGNHLL